MRLLPWGRSMSPDPVEDERLTARFPRRRVDATAGSCSRS